MNNYQLIKQAIEQKNCLTFTYDGHERKMSPHAVGTKKSKKQALFFQYSGDSKSGLSYDENDNWRCLQVSKIEDLSVNDDPYQTPYNYSVKKQTCIDKVDVSLRL